MQNNRYLYWRVNNHSVGNVRICYDMVNHKVFVGKEEVEITSTFPEHCDGLRMSFMYLSNRFELIRGPGMNWTLWHQGKVVPPARRN